MATKEAREIAATAWCKPTTSSKEMDVELAEVFAEIIDQLIRCFKTQMDIRRMMDEVNAVCPGGS